MFTIAKLLRTGYVAFNPNDTAALEELKANFGLYMSADIVMVDYLRLLNKRFKRDVIDREQRDKLIASFLEVPDEVVKRAGVSKKDYDQIKMLMKLDREIFMPAGKMHPKNYLQTNDFDSFVDFSRLPEKINKNAKLILYRPNLMAKLKKSFDAILKEIESDLLRKMEEQEEWKIKRIQTNNYWRRHPERQAEQDKIIQDLLQFIDEFFDKEMAEHKALKKSKAAKQISEEEFKLLKEKEDEFYMSALERLLKERRKVPKEERMKMKQDSVDEINTTDLENWVLRPNFHLVDQP